MTQNSTTTESYAYDSFGKLTASTGSLVNPFQYTARESDAETGLYYYRARYYDPNTGRFLNEDPTGFRGGINLYGCVGNDPINKTDPDGTGFVDCLQALTDLARAQANLARRTCGKSRKEDAQIPGTRRNYANATWT